MTRDKQKVIQPPGPTDHELLLLILDKLGNVENRLTNLENRVGNIVKLNNLKE